jgi:acetoacetate decarboxylase
MLEQVDAYLWWPEFLDRQITVAGPLDAEGFWPFADTIGGTRFPGLQGGPK